LYNAQFAQVSSVRSVGFNRPVVWSGSISTVGPRFHLLRDNTVDIDGRFGYTYGELRSILTVGSVHSTKKLVDMTTSVGSYEKKIGRRSMSKWTHSKKLKKSVDIEFAYPYFTMSVRVA